MCLHNPTVATSCAVCEASNTSLVCPEPSTSADTHQRVLSLRGGADGTQPPGAQAEADPHVSGALRSKAARKISLYTNFKVVTIKGDGRCMFRAIVRALLLLACTWTAGREPHADVRVTAGARACQECRVAPGQPRQQRRDA